MVINKDFRGRINEILRLVNWTYKLSFYLKIVAIPIQRFKIVVSEKV